MKSRTENLPMTEQENVGTSETASEPCAPNVAAHGIALSVQQPWAWLIVHGYKPLENREWLTNHRGPLSIHAGKTFDAEGYSWVRQNFPEIPMPLPTQFPKGGIVGRVVVVGCVAQRDRHLLTDADKRWFFGKFGFVLDSPEPLPLIPCRGMLGFFKPDIAP